MNKLLSISEGNTKLGRIPNFSLPALTTCPGKTKACEKVCYAFKGRSRMASLGAWFRNYQTVRKQKSSLKDVIAYCKGFRVPVFRIHVGGDFYSIPYIKAWIRVVKSCPKTVFFAYTRSWRVEKLRPYIDELQGLPNMRLWASFDKFTGDAPSNYKKAWMSLNDNEKPPNKPDLVFRVSPKGIAKHLFNAPCCPYENGTKAGKEINCQSCGICSR